MKFSQLSTGAVLEATNKEVIEMMKASDAYAVIEQQKPKGGKSDGKKTNAGGKSDE